MNLKSRLQRLEQTISAEPIVLSLPDNSEYRIYPRGATDDPIQRMVQQIGRGEISPDLEAVARSVDSREPGGAHMVDLVRQYLVYLQGADEATRRLHREHFEREMAEQREPETRSGRKLRTLMTGVRAMGGRMEIER